MSRIDWSYFDKYEYLTKVLVPARGEGWTEAQQIATAICKLIYKWYNDGDVYDNVHSGLKGWANDLSSYANWLWDNTDRDVRRILERIYDAYDEEDYENILKDLADTCLNYEYMKQHMKYKSIFDKSNSIYNCDGPFEYTDCPIHGTVCIDYRYGNFVIDNEDGEEVEGGFETMDDAVWWCEDKGVDYDTTEDAELRASIGNMVRIDWDYNYDRFSIIGEDGDEVDTFYDIDDAIDWCRDIDVDYEISDEAMNANRSMKIKSYIEDCIYDIENDPENEFDIIASCKIDLAEELDTSVEDISEEFDELMAIVKSERGE